MSRKSDSNAWPGFRYGQEDLRARSREPEVFEREYYSFNHLYCGAEILRKYAGLPDGRPVPWAIQAILRYIDSPGEGEDPSEPLSRSARKLWNSGMPILYPIDEARGGELRRFGAKRVFEIGAMFHYARGLYRRKGWEEEAVERRGTIALPDKSDLGKLVDFDREAYAAKLVALPEIYQPVYVSMHWQDYERGCHLPYLDAGLPVVSAGHPHDPLFYERLYDTFRRFAYSCSNEISTSFALSVLSGCRFFFLDGGDLTIQRAGGEVYQGREPTLEQPGKRRCLAASPFPPLDDDGGRQWKLAAHYSGEHLVREPEFFQERWREGREALSAQVPTSPLVLSEDGNFEAFRNWLPWGFDRDGWADPQCGLEIPAREGFEQVEIRLAFPPLDGERESTFSWTLDGDPATEKLFPVRKSDLVVEIPVPTSGKTREVRFEGPPAVALEGEGRSRSFRIVSLHWTPNPTSETRSSEGVRLRDRWKAFWSRRKRGA